MVCYSMLWYVMVWYVLVCYGMFDSLHLDNLQHPSRTHCNCLSPCVIQMQIVCCKTCVINCNCPINVAQLNHNQLSLPAYL